MNSPYFTFLWEDYYLVACNHPALSGIVGVSHYFFAKKTKQAHKQKAKPPEQDRDRVLLYSLGWPPTQDHISGSLV